MSEYTPATEEVRSLYAIDEFGFWDEDTQGAEFDRWLVEHDAQVLEAAATNLEWSGWDSYHARGDESWRPGMDVLDQAVTAIRRRAAEIRQGGIR